MNNFLEAALQYAEKGWRVFPCRVQSKTPQIMGGFHKATTDKEQIETWWRKFPQANVGVACDENSFSVIDVDTDGGFDSHQALKEEYEDFPKTLAQTTGSGGVHYMFKYHPEIGCTTGKLGKGIDTRGGNKGYVVVPPSIHENGKPYEWADPDTPLVDVPEWVISCLKGRKREQREPEGVPFVNPVRNAESDSKGIPNDDVIDRARLYLQACEPATQGEGGHSKLLWACTAMTVGFNLDPKQTYQLLAEEYNPRCNPPWNLADNKDKLEFQRKIVESRKNPVKPIGWLLEDNKEDVTLGKEMADALLSSIEVAPDVEKREEVPAEAKDMEPTPSILSPVGLVGDIVSYINATALKPQPMLALGNALAFCGALVGRKVKNEWDLRTNLYAVGVAESCAGKEHSRNIIKRLCTHAGVADRLLGGEDITSDAAIMACLAERQSVLFQWDEIGHMIVSMKEKFSSPIRKTVPPLLMRLTGSANSTFFGKEYADKKRQDVTQPNVCIYGTTVPDVLYDGLTSAEIRDGLLGRIQIFRSTDDYPMFDDEAGKIHAIPDNITKMIQYWVEFKPEAPAGIPDIQRHSGVFQVVVPTDKEAQDIFFDMRKEVNMHQRSALKQHEPHALLWGRAEEHAKRVALIIASLDCPHPASAHITEGHALYACELIMYQIKEFIHTVRFSIADSEQERWDKKIHLLILNAGIVGIRHSDLVRATRSITSKQRNEIIKGLLEGEYIVKLRAKVGHGYYYYAAQHAPKGK